MSHVLLVYDLPDSLATASDETRQAIYREYQALAQTPDLAGHRLQPGVPAITLTIRDGSEQLAPDSVLQGSHRLIGFYIVETDDADHARRLAARIPAARIGGAVEIHRLADE